LSDHDRHQELAVVVLLVEIAERFAVERQEER
jgi:hypothetical protein